MALLYFIMSEALTGKSVRLGNMTVGSGIIWDTINPIYKGWYGCWLTHAWSVHGAQFELPQSMAARLQEIAPLKTGTWQFYALAEATEYCCHGGLLLVKARTNAIRVERGRMWSHHFLSLMGNMMIGIFGKKLEIWKDPNLGVSEHISQGDQLWVQEVYTYTLYVDICSTPMWIYTIHTCTCIIFLKCPPIMRLLALTLFGVQMEIIFEEGGTVWIWNETWESILASMEFHSSEDLGSSLQNPSLHVPSFSLLFSDFTWTFLLLHRGVWPFWSQTSHMCWYCCVHHHHFTLQWLNPSARPRSPGLY